MTDEKKVLLLNTTEEVLNIISWKRAVKLVNSGKAVAPYNYKKKYKITTTKGNYHLPTAIILVKYVFLPNLTRNIQPTRMNVFKRDKWTCQYCGVVCKDSKSMTIDHIHPKSKGGGTQWTNVVTCCKPCNISKGNSILKDIPNMKLINKPKKPRVNLAEISIIDELGKKLWGRWLFYT